MEQRSRGIRIVKVLKQVNDYLKKNIKKEFAEMDLTGSQGLLVGTLAHQGEMKISELSERLGLSNSTVSGIIDRLEKQGCVERIRSKEDRRVVNVRVTPDFKKKAEKHFIEIDRQIDTLLNKATPEEAARVQEGLDILRRLMDRKGE